MAELLPWLEPVAERVCLSLSNDRVPHAWLIHGAEGLGKSGYAAHLARQLLCTGDNTSGPCEQCPNCHLSRADNHPDFAMVAPLDGKTSISVDQIRELIRRVELKSHQGARKVVLIDPAGAMTINAANSLLKTLEEPAGDSVLLLVSHHLGYLPATVVSRCQRLTVGTPDTDQGLAWLKGQNPQVDWQVPLALAGGAPLLAKDWVDSGVMEQGDALIRSLTRLIQGRTAVSGVSGDFEKAGVWGLLWLDAWCRDLIKVSQGLGERHVSLAHFYSDLQEASKNIKLHELFDYLQELRAVTRGFDGPANKALLMEAMLIPWQQQLCK